MATPRARYKKGRTTRLKCRVTVNGLALDLTGRTIEIKLAESDDAATVVSLTTGSGVTILDALDGSLAWDVTSANLTTLGTPDNVLTVINVYNADNTLEAEGSGMIEVAL